MNNIVELLINPNKIILSFYSFLSLFFILAYNFYYSFQWQFVFGIREYMIGLLILLSIGMYISIKIDAKYATRLRIYFKISLVQLLLVWVISNPIRTWQVESSKEKSNKIINSLEEYKSSFGTFPETLNDLVNIPRRTNIGTRYWYKKLEDNKFNLQFASYYGYWLNYENESAEWHYLDD